MASYNLRRLSCPNRLRAINSHYLDQLLLPHAAFLATRGIALPIAGREAPLKYLALVQLFLTPPADMPRDLLDAVYFIDQMATPTGLEELESAAEAAGTYVHQYLDVTAAEIVLQMWLADRQMVERVHAEMAVSRLRSFEYFQSESETVPQLPGLSAPRIQSIEGELNDCFAARRRGRYARILLSEDKDSVWLYVAHGGLMRREGIVDEGGSSTICYRPEVYDAMVFLRETGELGIHARSKWERALYQRLCGKHLFGDETFFSGAAKYTLAPLWNYGRAALRYIDVPGIEWVRLTDVQAWEPSKLARIDASKGDDVFASWNRDDLPYSPCARLLSATFRIKLAGSRESRRVTIRPANRAQYPQDADQPWIEGWLKKRGFIRSRGAHDESIGTILAVA